MRVLCGRSVFAVGVSLRALCGGRFATIVARRSHFFSSFVFVCVLEYDGTHGTAIRSTTLDITLDMVCRIKTRLNAPLKRW